MTHASTPTPASTSMSAKTPPIPSAEPARKKGIPILDTIAPSALYWNARTWLAWVISAGIFSYFALSDPNFLNEGNLYALAQIFSTLAIVSAGLALVMIAAEFDLSIAGTFPLAGLVAVKSADSLGWTWGVALAVLIGACIGVLNGLLTAALRIPSLAVTVATMVLAIGIGYAVTNGDLVNMTDFDASAQLTKRVVGVLSVMSIAQLVLALLAYFYMKTSWRGRFVYAIGSDASRARTSGLPVIRTITFAFVVSAVFASLAGALQGISLATGQAGSNDNFLLQCATAALIGGVALTGGRGSLAGVLGGAFLLALLTNGLGLAGVDSALIQLVNGVVLAAVVLLDRPLVRFIDRRIAGELPHGGRPPLADHKSVGSDSPAEATS